MILRSLSAAGDTPGGYMRIAALGAAALLTAVPAVTAQTTLRSAKDSTIRGGSYAYTNFGTDPILETRQSDDPTYVRRAAVMFDTEASFGSGTSVGAAQLVLTVKSGNGETRTLTACAMPISFDETSVSWMQRNGSSYWQTAGGDVVSSDCSYATVTATAGSRVTFDVTSQVQKAVAGTYGTRYARFLVEDNGGSSRDSYKQVLLEQRIGQFASPRARRLDGQFEFDVFVVDIDHVTDIDRIVGVERRLVGRRRPRCGLVVATDGRCERRGRRETLESRSRRGKACEPIVFSVELCGLHVHACGRRAVPPLASREGRRGRLHQRLALRPVLGVGDFRGKRPVPDRHDERRGVLARKLQRRGRKRVGVGRYRVLRRRLSDLLFVEQRADPAHPAARGRDLD